MKIICIARNYAEHAKELNNEVPENPVFFLKPDTALLQKERDFYLPEFSQNIQYEAEIVLKISKAGKYIQPEFALNYFEQISLGIDLTARDLQSQLKEKGHPWEISKAFDNSAVVGEFLDKKDFDLENLEFRLDKNKIAVQQGNTKDMIHGFAKIISEASKYFTLKTGDLIYTGTPAGVGRVEENDLLEGWMHERKVFEVQVK
ncbi:fumarylacetoacetate hydrolase family protein [Moheibacter sp.]|uniref:fumarylacetoacetate hydrolase family protein n=1 Tax=Moheibacter sp. TaxID=1965316 RepID=UPI003C79072B